MRGHVLVFCLPMQNRTGEFTGMQDDHLVDGSARRVGVLCETKYSAAQIVGRMQVNRLGASQYFQLADQQCAGACMSVHGCGVSTAEHCRKLVRKKESMITF